LFGKYNECAKKHGVFPLETIGDCSIFACGFKGELDHSTRMAKFALDMIGGTRYSNFLY
jgi:hypothetical protein